MDEIEVDQGRDAEVETVLSETAVHVAISNLDLGPPVCIQKAATVKDAVLMMVQRGIGSLLVLEGDRLAGIVTERDVLRKSAGTAEQLGRVRVEAIMTPNPKTLCVEDLVIEAMALMNEGGYRRVPILDASGRPVGVLSIKRIVDRLVEYFPEQVLNLPPSPIRAIQPREGA
ncbi:MAG: CBS domain-containing protein [Planctomycetes bacterium]|nr:CBS domain-containing protein [Planctomycetota bacterium]